MSSRTALSTCAGCTVPAGPHVFEELARLQATPMARVLLELLPGMGSNALIAHRVLRLMAGAGKQEDISSCGPACSLGAPLLPEAARPKHHGMPPGMFLLLCVADAGRIALRRAVVAAHCAATGAEEPADNPSSVTVAQAAQWMANR